MSPSTLLYLLSTLEVFSLAPFSSIFHSKVDLHSKTNMFASFTFWHLSVTPRGPLGKVWTPSVASSPRGKKLFEHEMMVLNGLKVRCGDSLQNLYSLYLPSIFCYNDARKKEAYYYVLAKFWCWVPIRKVGKRHYNEGKRHMPHLHWPLIVHQSFKHTIPCTLGCVNLHK